MCRAAFLSLPLLALLGTGARADPPCFVCDLPPDSLAANTAFRDRVAAAFPPGAKVFDMTDMLSAQKFRSDFWHRRRLVYRYDSGGPKYGGCSIAAYVDWEEDGAGYVSKIDARYMRTPDCASGF
jgi:hypothetical protein